ncbi:MAG: hypothetical protein ACI4KG_07180 [Oscillospiraceae bacterium]
MRTVIFKILTVICALILISAVIVFLLITRSGMFFLLSLIGAAIIIFPWIALTILSRDIEEMSGEITRNRKMIEKIRDDSKE